LGFRGFSGGSIELGLSGFSKWQAVKHLPSTSPKNWGETGIFAEGDVHVEIKDTGQWN